MKRSSTRLHRRRSVARRVAVPLLGAACVALSACVTRGTYQEVVDDRDRLLAAKARLEEEAELLQVSNRSLDEERVRLLDDMEDLRQQRELLQKDVAKLQHSQALLSNHLRDREAELAKRRADLEKLHGAYESLVSDLEAEVSSGRIQIEQLREGLRVNLSQEVLFPSGSATLNRSGVEVLAKVARQLQALDHTIEVQGHTDAVPISASQRERFPSNWELAAARASTVVRLLEKEGVDPERLEAVSYGQWHPVATNDTPEGRAQNRRIEIRLEPVVGSPAEAQPAKASAP